MEWDYHVVSKMFFVEGRDAWVRAHCFERRSLKRFETWRARDQVDFRKGMLQGTRVVCVARGRSTRYNLEEND